jgi:hypothetical protein
MSMVRMIVGGADTDADTHVAAAIDANGAVLGIESFPADRGGFEALLGWLMSHGKIWLCLLSNIHSHLEPEEELSADQSAHVAPMRAPYRR